MLNDDEPAALRRLLDQRPIERGEGRDIAEFFAELDAEEGPDRTDGA